MSDMNFNRSPVVSVGCSREKNIYNNINLALVSCGNLLEKANCVTKTHSRRKFQLHISHLQFTSYLILTTRYKSQMSTIIICPKCYRSENK